MQSVTNATFGPLIAYLVPGLTVLLGLSPFSITLRSWLSGTPENAPTVGGFLYLTIAALAVGLVVSAVRWVLIDTLHAATGLRTPRLDFGRLGPRVEAFNLLIEIHYRHYQFYANMLVALPVAYGCYRVSLASQLPVAWSDLTVLALEFVFFVTSRDTLRKYYRRTEQLLAAPTRAR